MFVLYTTTRLATTCVSQKLSSACKGEIFAKKASLHVREDINGENIFVLSTVHFSSLYSSSIEIRRKR